VLDDVDDTVLAFLAAALDGAAEVVLGPDGSDRPDSNDAAAVHVRLHDVRQVSGGRTADLTDVRDADGRVVARQPPPALVRCSYLVSVAAPDARSAHRLLGAVLQAGVDHDAVPLEHRRGTLAELDEPVELEVAPPDGTARDGRELAVELRLRVPVTRRARTDVAPPTERVELGVAGAATPAPPAPVPTERRWTTYRPR